MKKRLLILFICVCAFIRGQNKTDSLLTLLKTDAADTNKVIHLNKACWEYIKVGEYDKGLAYGKKALALANVITSEARQSHNNAVYLVAQKGIAISYNNIGSIYNNQGNYAEALKNYFAALKIYEEIGNKQGITSSYNNIGNIYDNQGNYPEALKNYFASLKICEEIGNKQGIASSNNNIGNIYANLGNYPEALKNYFASLKILEEIGDKYNIASSYNNLGVIYYYQGNLPEAFKMHFVALKIREEIKDKYGIATSYMNIAGIYANQGNYPEALTNHFASLKIKEEIGDKVGIAGSFINLGQIYNKLAGIDSRLRRSKLKEVQNYLDKALQLSKEIGYKDYIKETYASLAVLDSTTGNYKAAFEHHKLFIIYRDSLNSEETQKKGLQSAMQYEFDKKEIAAKAEQEKLDAVIREEKQKQRIVIYAVAGVLLLVIVFSIFLFNRFRITNRQKIIIEKQKERVDRAYDTLHEKNKEIIDSINYASRIQRALITSDKYIATQLRRLMKNSG